jgi:hypothetical protein
MVIALDMYKDKKKQEQWLVTRRANSTTTIKTLLGKCYHISCKKGKYQSTIGITLTEEVEKSTDERHT